MTTNPQDPGSLNCPLSPLLYLSKTRNSPQQLDLSPFKILHGRPFLMTSIRSRSNYLSVLLPEGPPREDRSTTQKGPRGPGLSNIFAYPIIGEMPYDNSLYPNSLYPFWRAKLSRHDPWIHHSHLKLWSVRKTSHWTGQQERNSFLDTPVDH